MSSDPAPELDTANEYPDDLLTTRQLAEHWGVPISRVVTAEREGLPVAKRGGRGRSNWYSAAQADAWREDHETNAQKAIDETHAQKLDLQKERARRERAQAILTEQTFEVRAGNLLPRDEVEKAWSAEVAAVRSKMLAWPGTVADILFRAGEQGGPRAIERELMKRVHEALRELAEPVETKSRRGTRKK